MFVVLGCFFFFGGVLFCFNLCFFGLVFLFFGFVCFFIFSCSSLSSTLS